MIPSDNKKILICGPPISGNKGGAALVAGTISAIKHYMPNAQFNLLSLTSQADLPHAERYQIQVVGIKHWHLPWSFLKALLWRVFKKINLDIRGLIQNDTILREYSRSDIILSMTGIGFHDFFGKLVILKHSLWLLPAILLKNRIAIYSQSLGPFESWFNRLMARLCLNRVDFLVIRGSSTKQFLTDLGIQRPIHLCADAGFLLKPCSRERLQEILAKEGLAKKNRPFLGVALNQVIDRKLNRENNAYIKLMVEILDNLIKEYRGTLIFIPHDNHDIGLARTVTEKMSRAQSCHLITEDYLAEELKGIIGLCDFFIGSRFHSIVASLSMGVPTVIIGWSHKYQELMSWFGQEDFILDFHSATPIDLKNKIDQAYQKRAWIQKELSSRLPGVIASSLSGGKIIQQAVN